ncbi:MAG: hypothetical protein J0H64_06865, partial [Actinobacteria bacterium]|nr:hypothetical protein [Actinomycetota bacterium]
TDDSLGDLFKKANAELDVDKHLAITSQINDTIAGFVPFVPIYPYPNIYVVDGKLANYGPATFKSIDWTQVGFKK